jgi:hypothetical protein
MRGEQLKRGRKEEEMGERREEEKWRMRRV